MSRTRSLRTRACAVLLGGALATTLAACGGDSDDDAVVPPSPVDTESADASDTPSESAAPEPAESETPDAAESDDAGDDGAAEADPGPQPEGNLLPAASVTAPPEQVGDFEVEVGENGLAHIYAERDTGVLITVGSTPLSSPFETLAGELQSEVADAGTGQCGITTGDSIVCYLRAENGVVNVGATTTETSVDDVVAFVNRYAAAAIG